MLRRSILAATGAIALGCGGLFVDDEGVADMVRAVAEAPPSAAVSLLVAGAAETGLVNPLCAGCIGDLGAFDPSQRAVVTAVALGDPTCVCPGTCVSPLLDELAPLDDAARMERIAEACGGDDPIFAGPLAPLRASAPALDYALARMVVEALDEDDRETIREPLAIGLAVATSGALEPTDAPIVVGAPVEILTDQADALRACGTHVVHRVVLRPDGTVAHVAGLGGCVDELLAKTSFPSGDAWRVVDLTWSASALASTTAAPGPASRGERPAAPSPAPAPAAVPMARLGAIEVTGGLPKEVVGKVVRRAMADLRGCPAGAGGTATVKFTVGRDGSVGSATATGVDGKLGSCLSARVMRLTFPAPSNGVATVTLPITISGG